MPPAVVDPTIFVVDDDAGIRELLAIQLGAAGFKVRVFASAAEFLAGDFISATGCIVADIRMPAMDGLALQAALNRSRANLPLIFMSAHADVPLAVQAMRAGAVEILQKPFELGRLLDSVDRALAKGHLGDRSRADSAAAREKVEQLTEREKEIFLMLVAGRPSKLIAQDLSISQRTVDVHRAKIMKKCSVRNIMALIHLGISSN